MNFNNIKDFLLKIIALAYILFFCGFNSSTEAYYSDRPLFVTISTDWCFACKLVKPTIEELKNDFKGEVEFVDLNVSSEDTSKEAELLASDYGISEFFNKSRGAFPTVGIISPTGNVEKVFIGTQKKETYTEVISNVLGGTRLANTEESRPKEPQIIEITGGRPEEPILAMRPNEPITSGRPEELTFWTIGQPIPYYAYNRYLILPKCLGNNLICSNITNQVSTNGELPKIFKPWDPNATRDEKGWKL